MYDLIIKNGLIIDGTGIEGFIGDIGIRDDRIIKIGDLKDKESKTLIIESLRSLKKLKRFKKELVLTHHDLNPKNIIFTKNDIKIIDWEYAGVNDAFFDLASICVEFNLNEKKEKILLHYYLKKITLNHQKKLEYFKVIYKNLCTLWFEKLNNF